MKSIEGRAPETEKSPARRAWRWVFLVAALTILWFAAGEGLTWYWYASHEGKMAVNKVPAGGKLLTAIQSAVDSEGGYQIQDRDIGSTATEMLKCSYGRTLSWSDAYGPSAMTVLEWGEHSYVGGVEDMHNPGVCLRAAGWTIGASRSLGIQRYGDATCETTVWDIQQGALSMHAFSAVFRRFQEAEKVDAELGKYWNSTRLRSVFSGRRDAPVLIVLGYFPEGGAFSSTPEERFDQVMRAAFRNSEAAPH